MIETLLQIREKSFLIAWNYLEATGEIRDIEPAGRFLLDTIDALMKKGEQRPLLLSNKASDAYKHWQMRQNLALVS